MKVASSKEWGSQPNAFYEWTTKMENNGIFLTWRLHKPVQKLYGRHTEKVAQVEGESGVLE
jgi:hypothetical protein